MEQWLVKSTLLDKISTNSTVSDYLVNSELSNVDEEEIRNIREVFTRFLGAVNFTHVDAYYPAYYSVDLVSRTITGLWPLNYFELFLCVMYICNTFQDNLTENDLMSLAKKSLIGYNIPEAQINKAQLHAGILLATE